jgi:DNA primase catalytic subunit
MIKESVLISCVLEFLKSHIANVVSLETVISDTQAYKLGEKIAAELRLKVSENSAKIEKLKDFKNRLYENLLGDIITKENYKILKTKYADDIKILEIENENLQKEITSALSCDGEKTAWLQRFKEFSQLENLDRKVVVTLIKSIKIISKTEIQVEFNWQDEYKSIVKLCGEVE